MYTAESNNASMSHAYSKPWLIVHRQKCNTEFRKPGEWVTAEAASLGSSDAAVRFYGLRLYGFLARLIWLVGYSSLVTGAPNRIRIIIDWLLSSVFGRDVTFIKLTK